jgi:hypothetical protein
MKAIKFLIFALLFAAAGQEASAQNIIVNNNNPVTMNVRFNFAAPCPAVATSTPSFSSTATPFKPGGTLVSMTISFTDNTCNPPQVVTVTVPVTSNPFNYSYTRCDGTIINFHLHYNGIDWILDIPC